MASLPSVGFNPFSIWQCPNCQHSFTKAEQDGDDGDRDVGNNNNHGAASRPVLFYRGTCRHDICIKCIANVMSLVSKKVKSEESVLPPDRHPILTTITCPIIVDRNRRNVRFCQGQFHVDAASIPPPVVNNDSNRVTIDLCDDDDKVEETMSTTITTAAVAGKVKKENVEEELPQSSGQVIVPVKSETLQPDHVLSTTGAVSSFSSPSSSSITQASLKPNTAVTVSKAPLPVTNICNLKPLFEEGDEVYAPWWSLEGPAWFPGKVISYQTIDAMSQYGPTRLYRILFDDGDYLEKVEDYNVFLKSDYELIESFQKRKKYKKYIGVRSQFDTLSTDTWAKVVGWYEITGEDGKVQSFSTLTDAMRAHDAMVVRKHGAQTERSRLNIPENYPELFASKKANKAPEDESGDDDKSIGTTRTTRLVRSNVVSPESSSSSSSSSSSIVGVKRDPNTFDNETVVFRDRESKIKRIRLEINRRQLDPDVEEKLSRTDFWSVNQDHIQFTEQAFMNNPLFHLNSFVNSAKKVNEGFSELIREGIATPGFLPLPISLDVEKIADWTHKELREELTKLNDGNWGATATATWLKNATVGSFVIMRHCYPKCKFCPKRLFNDGSYIGQVYVIGIITKKVIPWSKEEREIAEVQMGEFSNNRWPIHNVCRVEWKRMGKLSELKESTIKYLSKIVQPTLQQICEDSEKVFDGGGTSESIRWDLWNCATEEISSTEFPDTFEHNGIPDAHMDQLLQALLRS